VGGNRTALGGVVVEDGPGGHYTGLPKRVNGLADVAGRVEGTVEPALPAAPVVDLPHGGGRGPPFISAGPCGPGHPRPPRPPPTRGRPPSGCQPRRQHAAANNRSFLSVARREVNIPCGSVAVSHSASVIGSPSGPHGPRFRKAPKRRRGPSSPSH